MNYPLTSIASVRKIFGDEAANQEACLRAEEKQELDRQAFSYGAHRNRNELGRHWSERTREAFGDKR